VGIFYVAKITQTLAGHIFDCTGGTATSSEAFNGTLGATGPQTVTVQPNPLNPTDVASGAYTMTATPPTGFKLVVCGGSATILGGGTSATEAVTVPSGGAGVGIFYVAKITQTLAGHIYNCVDLVPTASEAFNGTLGATGPQTVTVQPNPLNPTDVAAGAYTMTATPPPGFRLVSACGGTATILGNGTSATELVTVPSGGAGVGIFYVAQVPVTPTGPPPPPPPPPPSSPPSAPPSAPLTAVQSVILPAAPPAAPPAPVQVLGETLSPQTAPASPAAVQAVTQARALPFTGSDNQLPLETGFGLIALGGFALWAGSRREITFWFGDRRRRRVD
jgi:hypothetical protein